MKDELGTRIKEFYENRTRIKLPRKTYTILRLDGRSFSNYTRGLERPFDNGLIEDMDETACYLCKNIQGAKFGFVQSDEISILVTDFDKIGTDAWFDGNIQKMVSISASMAASKFNHLRMKRIIDNSVKVIDYLVHITPFTNDIMNMNLANFDARVFTIPSKTEVANMMVWRQQDTVRNSISSVAQSLYSHNELNCKTTNQMQDLIHEKGINWNDYPAKQKRGRFIEKQEIQLETSFESTEKCQHAYVRNKWVSIECPIFTQNMDFLYSRIPDIN